MQDTCLDSEACSSMQVRQQRYDGLASTTELSDDEGTVTGTYEYDVFSLVRAHSGSDSEWSYTWDLNRDLPVILEDSDREAPKCFCVLCSRVELSSCSKG
jgi:hypothetical protein